MKGIMTIVGIVAVGGLGVYLYKRAHTTTETREITDEEFEKYWDSLNLEEVLKK